MIIVIVLCVYDLVQEFDVTGAHENFLSSALFGLFYCDYFYISGSSINLFASSLACLIKHRIFLME